MKVLPGNNTTLVDWTTLATTVTAIYAAVLSTVLAINNYLSKRVRIDVEIGAAITFNQNGDTTNAIRVVAINRGGRIVALNSVGLRLPDGKTFSAVRTVNPMSFPVELAPERSCTVLLDYKKFVESMQESGYEENVDVHGHFSDEAGRQWLSKETVEIYVDRQSWGIDHDGD